MLVRRFRERTVAPIAVVSRFFEFSLAGKIRTQHMLSKRAFLRKAFGRPLPLFRNQSVLSAGFSGKIILKIFIEITKRKVKPGEARSERSKTGVTTRSKIRGPVKLGECFIFDTRAKKERKVDTKFINVITEVQVRRMTELEGVFGQLKNNRGFRRFLLRGLSKVTLGVGWLSLAYNLLKQATTDQKRKRVSLQ